MIVLENEEILVKIKSKGAELSSFIDKKDGFEHMWQGNPKVWKGQAPILFPIVGELKDGKTLIDDKHYKMKRHGFLNKMIPEVKLQTKEKVIFSFCANSETLTQYPFNFRVEVCFEIIGRQIVNTFSVSNDGDIPMPFNIGGHPAFTIPFAPNESIEDCFLEFEHAETASRHMIDDKGLFSGELRPVFENSNRLYITKDLFNEDALIFKDLKSRAVTIKSNKSNRQLRVKYSDWPYLGIWAKPAAKYVCIEPWLGCADHTNSIYNYKDKELITWLGPDETKEIGFDINI